MEKNSRFRHGLEIARLRFYRGSLWETCFLLLYPDFEAFFFYEGEVILIYIYVCVQRCNCAIITTGNRAVTSVSRIYHTPARERQYNARNNTRAHLHLHSKRICSCRLYFFYSAFHLYIHTRIPRVKKKEQKHVFEAWTTKKNRVHKYILSSLIFSSLNVQIYKGSFNGLCNCFEITVFSFLRAHKSPNARII